MGISFDGFDDLLSDLDNLGDVGKKAGKKAIEEGSKVVLEQQKKDAPKDKDGEHGADKLKVTNIKTYKSGTVVGKVGIDESNWDEVDHLYYQHYGYELWKNGERVEPHLGWMDDSFRKVKDKTSETMMEVVSSEIDKILK
ncbi:MAG: HK97 gp10 family phage protein [Clostridium sp.]|nr:HK97 gp10 family phage protein [Clostridium sp.]